MRKLDFRLVVGLILVSVIATSAIWYVWAATPTTTIWISPGIYPGAPSYTVWREGSNYFAKDANGQIDYSGTNVSEIHESIVNAFSTTGGEIHYTEGQFMLSSSLIYKSNVTISGEGASTVLYADTNMNDDIIRNGTTGNIFGITIKDLAIYGNLDNQSPSAPLQEDKGVGITFHRVQRSTIQNVYINYTYVWGILLGRGTRNTVIDCKIEKTGYDGIIIGAQECYSKVIGTYVYEAGQLGVSGDGISIYNGAYHNQIIDCVAYGSIGSDFAIAGLQNNPPDELGECYGNIIDGCISRDAKNAGIYVGEAESDPPYDMPFNIISNNVVWNSSWAGICLNESDKAIVSNNFVRYGGIGGIQLNNSVHCVVEGNIIIDTTGDGIFIYNTNASSFSGNVIQSSSSNGIYELGTSDYNNIIGSNCFDDSGYGIKMTTAAGSAHSRITSCYNGTTWIATWGTG